MIIKIKGIDVKFSVGLYFLGKAQKEYNTDLQGLLNSLIKNPLADMVDLMYYSAKCEAQLDDIEVPITKREFVSYLEDSNDFQKTDGVLAEWSKKFVESIRGNFLPENEEVTADGEKKN